jgi:hypothetical protein
VCAYSRLYVPFHVSLQGMSRPNIADALGHGRDSDGELERDEIVPRRESPGTDGTATATVVLLLL